MNKQQIIARWHIVKARCQKEGIGAELDAIGEHSFTVRIKTARESLSDFIEWAFTNWKDVRSCGQSQDDSARYFFMIFKASKKWSAEKEAEAEGDEEEDD